VAAVGNPLDTGTVVVVVVVGGTVVVVVVVVVGGAVVVVVVGGAVVVVVVVVVGGAVVVVVVGGAVVVVVVGGAVVVVVVGGAVVVVGAAVVVGARVVVVLVVVVGRGRRGLPHRPPFDRFHEWPNVHGEVHVTVSDDDGLEGDPAIGGRVNVAHAATEPMESMVVRTSADAWRPNGRRGRGSGDMGGPPGHGDGRDPRPGLRCVLGPPPEHGSGT
jgi:hypothetical protein